MSVSGIFSSNYFQPNFSANQQSQVQTIKQDFQQLGQDLQAGNLSQAQQDYTTLTQAIQNGTSNANPAAQAFSALGQALQSGDLAGAQQAFATLQQDLQGGSQVGHHHHHHHHSDGGSSGSISSSSNPFAQAAQEFNALGQALQAGNLSAAQQDYAAIQQDLQAFTTTGAPQTGTNPSSNASNTPAATPTVNVTA